MSESATIMDPDKVAESFRDALKQEIESGKLDLQLVGLLANQDPGSETYARLTEKSCNELGINFRLIEVDKYELEQEIRKANEDTGIHGIIVYYPVFGGTHDAYLKEVVAVEKDVEGLNASYSYNLYHNIRYIDEDGKKKSILPCTPLAIVKMLDFYGVYDRKKGPGAQMEGRIACVVNRSEISGRPLAAMLAHDGAFVYSCDINGVVEFEGNVVRETEVTQDEAIKKADLIVTGVPATNFEITAESIKPGATVIDYSWHENLSANVADVAGHVAFSIGKVTISMLQRNLLRLYENFHK